MTGSAPLCEIRDGGADDEAGSPQEILYWHCPGDPELIAVTPSLDFAYRFAFTTEHQFADTYLVLIRRRGAMGVFSDVRLDCAGTLEGWKPIGSADDYETLTVPLSRGNFESQSFPGGSCTLGAHTMTSDGPFTGYLWGWTHEGVDGLEEGDDGSGRSYGFALFGIEPEPDHAH